MAATFTKIATVTVGSGGSSTIEFTSIPATYSDLAIYLSARQSTDDLGVNYQFNNDTGNNYSNRSLYGTGSATGSGNASSFSSAQVWSTARSLATASVFGNTFVYIPNYAGSNQKSFSVDFVDENNATAGYQMLNAPAWTGTAAITSIKLTAYAANFVQYSTATLYGIKNS